MVTPLYSHYFNLFSQFGLYSLLSYYGSITLFKIYFIIFCLKYFLFEAMFHDIVMIVHHIISIIYVIYFCNTRALCWMITVGEIGSGSFNLYNLAKAYNIYVQQVYIFYVIVMTISNLYLSKIVLQHNIKWYHKIIPFVLIVGRQIYVYI